MASGNVQKDNQDQLTDAVIDDMIRHTKGLLLALKEAKQQKKRARTDDKSRAG